jgi:hypothetical protein
MEIVRLFTNILEEHTRKQAFRPFLGGVAVESRPVSSTGAVYVRTPEPVSPENLLTAFASAGDLPPIAPGEVPERGKSFSNKKIKGSRNR